jgi:glycosyltransferase involved in cell wall biosynthesis
MKALIITPMHPELSLVGGVGVTRRMSLFMSAMGSLSEDIHIAYLAPSSLLAEDQSTLEQLQARFWGLPLKMTLVPRGTRRETFRNHYLDGISRAHDQPPVYSFAGPEQAQAIGTLLDQDHDLVFVHHLIAMCAVLRSGRQPKNMFFDLDDVDHRVRLRYALSAPRWLGKLAYAAHVPALLAAERQGIAFSRQTFVCSAGDKSALRRWSPRGKITVVPNGLPVPAAVTRPANAPNLLFLGACEYPPNIEAAERLVKVIFPIVRNAVPEARLVIAGGGSERLPSRKESPANVDYLGYVPDLDALYANARIVCCPLVNGGGTRIKLIEAAAYGRPMVSSHVGAEGLDFAEGSEILLRDSDADFAQACIGLLQDEQACARLGAAARIRMQQLYDAGKIVDQVRALMVHHWQGRQAATG